MKGTTSIPNSSLVYDLYTGGVKPQIIRISLLLDIYTPLLKGPLTAKTAALLCGCDEEGFRFLLDYLCSLSVLDKRGGEYTLTETAREFLVPSSPSYAGDFILHFTGYDMWNGVLNTLQGQSRKEPGVPWHQDAWLESYSQTRIPDSLEMWAKAGFTPGKCSHLSILDVACGCAIKTFSLAQTDESIHITCIDGEKVLGVVQDLAVRLGVSGQVSYQPGDIHTVDFGTDVYDAALLGQISYLITLDQNLSLFHRVYKALKPGGVLVIDAAMATDTPDELASERSLFLWAMYGGSAHSFEEYKLLLTKAGFIKIEQHSEWWLTASKQ